MALANGSVKNDNSNGLTVSWCLRDWPLNSEEIVGMLAVGLRVENGNSR
jgi:hypothetical protein